MGRLVSSVGFFIYRPVYLISQNDTVIINSQLNISLNAHLPLEIFYSLINMGYLFIFLGTKFNFALPYDHAFFVLKSIYRCLGAGLVNYRCHYERCITRITTRRNGISCDINKSRLDVIIGIIKQLLISTNTIKHEIHAELLLSYISVYFI